MESEREEEGGEQGRELLELRADEGVALGVEEEIAEAGCDGSWKIGLEFELWIEGEEGGRVGGNESEERV